MRSRKLVWFLMLGILIALAGCGGNGGSSIGDGDDTVDMTALTAAQSAAMAAYGAAQAAVDAVEDDKSANMDAYNNAVEQRDAAKEANDKAQAATTVADAEKYKGMAEDANMQAMKYAAMVTTAAGNAAAAARAKEIAPAIARPNPSPADGASEFDNDIDRNSPNNPPSESLTDFTTRPLTVDGSKVSHSDTKKFTMSANAPAALTGFAGSIHTREDRAAATSTQPMVTDEVTVYTDQEDAKPTPFSGVHILDAGGEDDSESDPHTALEINPALATTVSGKMGQL